VTRCPETTNLPIVDDDGTPRMDQCEHDTGPFHPTFLRDGTFMLHHSTEDGYTWASKAPVPGEAPESDAIPVPDPMPDTWEALAQGQRDRLILVPDAPAPPPETDEQIASRMIDQLTLMRRVYGDALVSAAGFRDECVSQGFGLEHANQMALVFYCRAMGVPGV
jgi:hypothetical protein